MPAEAVLEGLALGSYPSQPIADIAVDVALLLKDHFKVQGSDGQGDQAQSSPPRLTSLPQATVLWERPEWAQLAGCASLADALQQLATSGLAEKVSGRADAACWGARRAG